MTAGTTPRGPDPAAPGAATPAVLVRWRTLPDFLAATLGFARPPNCRSGPDRDAPPALEETGPPAETDPADPADLVVPEAHATLRPEFASPAARARDFPPVRLVRSRCVLHRSTGRCTAVCPPGGVVIGGGAERVPPHAEVETSGPSGAGAWTVGVRSSPTSGGGDEPVRIAVWAMCV